MRVNKQYLAPDLVIKDVPLKFVLDLPTKLLCVC